MIDRHAKLSALRAMAAPVHGYSVAPSMLRSIQQSLRVEGHDIQMATIERVAREFFGEAR